jgi:hypothetical protein
MSTKAFADAFLDQRRRGYDDERTPPPGDGIRMGYFIEAFHESAARYYEIVLRADFTDPVRSTTALAVYQTATQFQGLFQSEQVAFERVRDLARSACAEHRGKALDDETATVQTPPVRPSRDDPKQVRLSAQQEQACEPLETIFRDYWDALGSADEEALRQDPPDPRGQMGRHAAAFDRAVAEIGEPSPDEDLGPLGIIAIRQYCFETFS